jgi:G protein-coupled receptor Mth (Methuselah protein)
MGINWVMEIVSWAAGGPDYIWYVTDAINILQGVIIFSIFVLEPRIRECVWKHWGSKISKILCHRCNTSTHVSVPYSTPEVAAVKVDTGTD